MKLFAAISEERLGCGGDWKAGEGGFFVWGVLRPWFGGCWLGCLSFGLGSWGFGDGFGEFCCGMCVHLGVLKSMGQGALDFRLLRDPSWAKEPIHCLPCSVAQEFQAQR